MSATPSLQRPRVLYLQFTNPEAYPPLEHSAHLLADAGCAVRFLGTRAPGTEGISFAPHPDVEVRRSELRGDGRHERLDYLRYALWALWHVFTWRPDWIYASDPIVTPIAWLLSLGNIPVIYHEHDAPLGEPRGLFARVFQWSRARLVRRTAVNIVPNRDRAALLPPADREPVVVWNCPSTREVVTRRPRTTGPLRLVYHGSLGPDKLPLTLVQAIADTGADIELHVVGYEPSGAIGYRRRLLTEAARVGIADNVHFHGTMPRDELLKFGATCDVGVMLTPMVEENANYRAMVGASNKAFDYLASGLAVLVSRTPQWEDAFVAPGLARACVPDDPASISEQLRWFVSHREEVARMGAAGRERVVSAWNYEQQFAPIKTILVGTARRSVVPPRVALADPKVTP